MRLTFYLPICEVFQLKQAITTELRVCMTFCFFTLRNKGERTNLLCFQPRNKNLRSFHFYFVTVVQFILHPPYMSATESALVCWYPLHVEFCYVMVYLLICVSAFTLDLGALDKRLLLCLHLEFCSFCFAKILQFYFEAQNFVLRIWYLLQKFLID